MPHCLHLPGRRDGAVRYLRTELTRDYAGLLRPGTGTNEFGGGQPLPPSVAKNLSFKIEGVVLAV